MAENRKRNLSIFLNDEEDETVSEIMLENYLRNKETNSREYTHYCNEKKVCYLIEDEEYNLFLKLYSSVVLKRTKMMIELPKKVYQSTFHFLFKKESGQGQGQGASVHFMRSMIVKIFVLLKSLFKTNVVCNIEDCIVGKSSENEQRDIYIVQFKNIVIYDVVFKFVRNKILEDEELTEMFDEMGFTNTFENAFKDDSNILMVGSCYDGDRLIYSQYDIYGDNENNFSDNLEDKWEISLLLKHLSLRQSNYSEVMPLNVVGELNLSISHDILFNERFISQMVGLVNKKNVHEEDIMWALINLSLGKDLFPLMERFSQGISRFYWNQMLTSENPDKKHLGISTLFYYSSIHSEEEFKFILFENIWFFIRSTCDKYVSFKLDEDKRVEENENENENENQNENESEQLPNMGVDLESFDAVCYYIAKLSSLLYSNLFVCTDIGRKQWYHFNGIKWIKNNKGVFLSKLIDNDLYSLFHYWSVKFMREPVSDGDKFVRNYYAKSCSDFASFVRNPLKKKMLLNVCAEHYFWDNDHILNSNIKSDSFEEVLDTNKYLIGCCNGVYDLSLETFRDAKPDDLISLSTRNYYREYAWNDPCVIEITDFLKKVFPNQNILIYVMKLFASFLDGDIEEQFYIFTGNGSNGKSKLVELFQLTFGEYVGTLPVSLITGKRTQSSSATPEVVRMKGKRLGVMHESNESDSINLGLIKAISGGDKMYARGLHMEPIEFRPTFQLLLLCNDKPKKIDPYDFAMWRRIVVVNFNSSFVDNPDPEDSNQFKKDGSIHKKLNLWKEGFFWILTQYYIELKNHGNPIPEQVLFDTNLYRKTNDFVGAFLHLCVERTDSSMDVIYASDLFSRFKSFYVENYQEPNRLKYDNFVKIVSSNLGDAIYLERNKKGWSNIIVV